ncbi:MAG: HDOD domain-containing protein [Candidatus Marinimicrobia bacterium]|nr:HDOD domain-containing protein [Candidatus Neomarinimicrobiota bacterium]MCF7880550.1 HDOD domain-containing protein [Candidatus Neomarinimicrobiota bacterium]
MISDEQREQIETKIGNVGSLPTLPDVVVKITELVNSPNSSMRQIESVIEVDPVLSSTVLKVVNSSFYGMAQEISALRLALVILGIKEIKNLVLSLSVFRLFSGKTYKQDFNLKDFWHHSATTGQIAKTLSQRLNLQFAGEEFVGGLIHDIGKVVLFKTLDDEYIEVMKYAREKRARLHQVEMDTFGFHHGHVGGWLGEKWHLPKKLIATVVYHNNPKKTPEYQQLVGIVSLASALTRAAGANPDAPFEAFILKEHPAMQMLMDNTIGFESIDWERFTLELGTDVRKSVEFVTLSQQSLWKNKQESAV